MTVTATDGQGQPVTGAFRVIVNEALSGCVYDQPDCDHDGVPDWQELIAGTDPCDPNSVFKLGPIELTNGDVRIWFPALGGNKYQLLATSITNLVASNFVPVGPLIQAVGPYLHMTNIVDAAVPQIKPRRARSDAPYLSWNPCRGVGEVEERKSRTRRSGS